MSRTHPEAASERQAFLDRFRQRVLKPGGGAHRWEAENYLVLSREAATEDQIQTNASFSDKWERYGRSDEKERLYAMQRSWFLNLYGFADEESLGRFLQGCPVILDAGCGLGYKSAWFAELAPDSLVIGVDYSTAAAAAAAQYKDLPNLLFARGDIADVPFESGSCAFVCCDQVIMHTHDPDATFTELSRLTSEDAGEVACYFYARKALPRELLDEHFRRVCVEMSPDELWEMSEQLTELGRRLSELKVEIDVPAVPAMGIRGGVMDVQRFIYWNFLKCFWNPDLGAETSTVTNFDWYSPSNARRYTKEEVLDLVRRHGLGVLHFHVEDACFSGRFSKGG